MELVTPNLGTIFWMVIIFWLVVVILRKFAWKPIPVSYTHLIVGDIVAGKLSVEPGSTFTGTCSMDDTNLKNEKSTQKEQKEV